jgi:hypothetical protein
MGNLERRVKRLENQRLPKEIEGPYANKVVSEEWEVACRSMLEEHYQKYPAAK